MGGEVRLKTTADNRELLRTLDEVNKRVVTLEKQLETTSAKSKKLTAEERRVASAAKKAFDDLQSPTQKHQANLEKLNAAVAKGTINQSEYAAAVRKSEMQLSQASGAMSTTARAHDEAFGPKALATIARYAAGVFSISTALQKTIEYFNAMDQLAEDAAGRAKGERAGLAGLAGLATSPEEAQTLLTNAREAFTRGVGKTEDETANLHYALKSAGLYDDPRDRTLFENLSKSGVLSDARPAVEATAKLQAAMGVEETGDATAVMSKLYQAADATQYEAQDIAKAVAEPALFAKKLGMSDEELVAQAVAGMAVLPVSKVDSSARAYYQALLLQGGYEGLSATDQVAKVKQTVSPMSAEDQKKYFGSVEAQTYYEILASEQGERTVKAEMAALPEAERNQLAVTKAKLPDVDRGLRLARMEEEARRENQAEDRPEGYDRLLTERIIEERSAAIKRKYGSGHAWGQSQAFRWGRWFAGDEATIKGFEGDRLLSEETRQEIRTRLHGSTERTPAAETPAPDDRYYRPPQPTPITPPADEVFRGLPGGLPSQLPAPVSLPVLDIPRLQPAGHPVGNTQVLEDATRQQTQTLDSGQREMVTLLREISGKLQPVTRITPVPTVTRPLPASTSAANRAFSE